MFSALLLLSLSSADRYSVLFDGSGKNKRTLSCSLDSVSLLPCSYHTLCFITLAHPSTPPSESDKLCRWQGLHSYLSHSSGRKRLHLFHLPYPHLSKQTILPDLSWRQVHKGNSKSIHQYQCCWRNIEVRRFSCCSRRYILIFIFEGQWNH